ncbi:hypothetical protein E2P81_ATG10323 [Venturia nashicola]|nr:hypothetical protein E2P81_ATG10323 [Venturia nashicola]
MCFRSMMFDSIICLLQLEDRSQRQMIRDPRSLESQVQDRLFFSLILQLNIGSTDLEVKQPDATTVEDFVHATCSEARALGCRCLLAP